MFISALKWILFFVSLNLQLSFSTNGRSFDNNMGKCAMKYNKYTQGVHRTSSQHKWKIYETNTKQKKICNVCGMGQIFTNKVLILFILSGPEGWFFDIWFYLLIGWELIWCRCVVDIYCCYYRHVKSS